MSQGEMKTVPWPALRDPPEIAGLTLILTFEDIRMMPCGMTTKDSGTMIGGEKQLITQCSNPLFVAIDFF